VISCFKWFSTVFERLKPRLRVFSTSSLSKYNTTFLLLFILHSHPFVCDGGGRFIVISLVLAAYLFRRRMWLDVFSLEIVTANSVANQKRVLLFMHV
jgi:hypothetical protein